MAITIITCYLFSGSVKKYGGASVEMQASDNPLLSSVANDPMLFCTGYKKNRFYIFSKREADTRFVCIMAAQATINLMVPSPAC